MSNENCLAGMACPHCEQNERFKIAAQTWATVEDEGVEDHADMEWTNESACLCPECGCSGTVGVFTAPTWTAADYAKDSRCPHCGSQSLCWSPEITFGGDFLEQQVECESCGKKHGAIYVLDRCEVD